MSIKLIVTDLDGTLMAPDHQTVTPRTLEALRQAHDTGVKIAIATGRTLSFTKSVTEQIPFIDYVIYSNGASVYDRVSGEDIYKNHISPEDTKQLLTMLDEKPVYYNIYVDGKIYIQNNKAEFYVNRGLPQKFLDEFMAASVPCESLVDALDGKSSEIIAIFSVNDEAKEYFRSKFTEKSLYVTSSLTDEIEATAPNVNKGTAIDGFCKKIGITTDEVMAFGDAMNDYEMLELVKYSFAMGNAVDECKKVAAFTTLTNAEDGLAVAVEKYVLNK